MSQRSNSSSGYRDVFTCSVQQFCEGSKAVDLPTSVLCDEDTFERLKKCNGCCVRQLCEGAKAGNGGLAGRHPLRQAGCLSRVAHRLRRHSQRLLPAAAAAAPPGRLPAVSMWHPAGAKTPPRSCRCLRLCCWLRCRHKLVVEVLSFVMKALWSQRPGRQHGCQQLLQLCLIRCGARSRTLPPLARLGGRLPRRSESFLRLGALLRLRWQYYSRTVTLAVGCTPIYRARDYVMLWCRVLSNPAQRVSTSLSAGFIP